MPLRLRPLLAALAPPLCWACRGTASAREPLCRSCREELRFLTPSWVEVTGVPLCAAVAYEGPARDLVRGLKYRGAAGLVDALAAQIAVTLRPAAGERPAAGFPSAGRVARSGGSAPYPPATGARSAEPLGPSPGGTTPLVAGCAVNPLAFTRGSTGATHRVQPPALVPVPMAAARARRRGFNQAALLADALGRRTGLPMADCLERRRTGAPQVGRGRVARLMALEGAIGVRPGSEVPARALLVDDVVTTGATLAACAQALRAAGCPDPAAVAYARALGR